MLKEPGQRGRILHNASGIWLCVLQKYEWESDDGHLPCVRSVTYNVNY